MLNKNTQGYIHCIQTLRKILFDDNTITGPVPKIKTILWDHQKDSVSRILKGFYNGNKGFGEASSVGSGKTLVALKIASQLIKDNTKGYYGILVLLPGNKLIKTWDDEITKHSTGFDVIFQNNDSNIGNTDNSQRKIKRNSIVITTMARSRDHPINHKWLLVIIDECLSVQNKNALQTENAWVQSLMSKYLLMMSATFFRTRFDKLYYMLKMLQTGLPERREYLETILLESIVSQISKIERNWTSNFHYFELDDKIRQEYEKINVMNLKTEAKYSKLNSFLVSNPAVANIITKQLAILINNLEQNNRKCLIYTYSMMEAQHFSATLKIPIYPQKGKHCIVTYHDGTYGLNDLVIYNTIIMRPPQPDKLPQIKGRLDRPGNKFNNLFIEYFVLKDTIEMGLILRLNIASQFVQKYIMPLAKFYDISIHYQKYLDDA